MLRFMSDSLCGKVRGDSLGSPYRRAEVAEVAFDELKATNSLLAS